MASIDVAIPCYNYGRFLRPCVESVLAQGIADLRILIIDNASTDDSVAVARALAQADSRVQVRARPVNLGPQASFNEGVDWAEADYFMILCADDLLAPCALRRAVRIMQTHPDVSFVYGRDVEHRQGDPLPRLSDSADASWTLVSGVAFIEERCREPAAYVAAGAVLTRTKAHKLAGHYRPELPYTDDLEMLLRLAALGPVAKIDAVQGVRRLHGANMSEQFLKTRAHDLAHREAAFTSFFANEGGRMPESKGLQRLAGRHLAERAYWWGLRSALRGRARDAADLLGFALRRWPTMAVLPPVNFLLRVPRT
jgi:glycosyltransferase involved in cell wall biosynthesis